MDQLFDLRAIRIMVDTDDTCYKVVSLIHDTWNYLESEYDDYISNRKSNGYQSIHTVVLGLTITILKFRFVPMICINLPSQG